MTTPLDQLSQMIPPDLALANKALAVSMQGITNISTLSLPSLASAAANVQTTFGLPAVSAQTSAVAPATASSLLATAGSGTGTNGTVLINNVMGTAAGTVMTDALTNSVSIINGLAIQGLGQVYKDMLNTVNGVYGNPITGPVKIPSGPAAGTYPAATAANLTFTTSASGSLAATGRVIFLANTVTTQGILPGAAVTFKSNLVPASQYTQSVLSLDTSNPALIGLVFSPNMNLPVGFPIKIVNVPATPIFMATAASVAFSGQKVSQATATPSGAGLIPSANKIIAGLTNTQLNTNWTNMMTQLNLEKSNQTKAGLDFTQLQANNTPAVYGFASQLPQYGQDTAVGGMNQYLQSLTTSGLSGESIVATLRQGQTGLNSTGISSNNQIPAAPNPPPPEAKLSPSQYPYP
jgi:hypothetical protein